MKKADFDNFQFDKLPKTQFDWSTLITQASGIDVLIDFFLLF